MTFPPSVPSGNSTPLRKSKPVQTGPTRPTGDDDIPTEIYLKIIALLAKQDLITCLRVSRFIHIATCSILYPTIYSTVGIDLKAPLSPGKKQGVFLSPIPPSKPSVGVIDETSVDRSGFRTSIVVLITKEPLPNRFEYTTHLTLPSHNHSLCSKLPPIIAPQLHTLRIRASGPEAQLQVCSSGLKGCPIIQNLKPRRLIIGGLQTSLAGSADNVWGAIYKGTSPYPSLREVVVLVGMFSAVGSSTADSLKHLPNTVEKLTLVMSCAEKRYDAVDEADDSSIDWDSEEQSPLTEALDKYNDIEALLGSLVEAAAGMAKTIEIVGAEIIEREWEELDGEDHDVKADIRSTLRSRLIAKGWSAVKAAERAGRMMFTTEEDFARAERWYKGVSAECREVLVAKLRQMTELVKQQRAAAEAERKREAKKAILRRVECRFCLQVWDLRIGQDCPKCDIECEGWEDSDGEY